MKKNLLLLILLISGVALSQNFDGIPTASVYYINKLIVSPGGPDLTNEYLEVRGPANAVIPSNLYLISIEGDGESGALSRVDEAIQLGDGTRTFGSNGLLAIVCNYTLNTSPFTVTTNPYTSSIGSGTTIITIELTGNNVTGGSSSNTSSQIPDIGYDGNFADASGTYMLITSDVDPDGDNIDVLLNSDGITAGSDGIIDATGDHIDNNWVLYDSISYLDDDGFGANGEFGYGQIVFAQRRTTDGDNTSADGTPQDNTANFKITTSATIVNHDSTSDVTYIVRQGLKTGYTTNDWIAAGDGSGTSPALEFTGSNNKINREFFKGFAFNTDIFYGQLNPVEPNVWNGTTADWATATNWNLGIIPASGEIVTIGATANNPIISGTTGASTENISVDPAALLTINSGGSLIVNGIATGNITYKRTITKDTDLTNAWYAISSPVTGATVTTLQAENNFAAGSGGNRIGLATYSNNGSGWTYFTTSSTNAIISGIGLTAKLDNGVAGNDVSFTGTYTNTIVEPVITQNGTNFFNFVGNPYTSYINLGTFFTDNNAVNRLSEQTIWIWDENKNGANMGGYVQKMFGTDATFEIAPGQGFFVSAGLAASNKVTFNTSNQSHQTDSFLKTSSDRTEIKLQISQENLIHSTKLYYIEGTTTGFDNGFDGSMFGGLAYDLAIYTELITENNGRKIGIQSLPNSDYESMIIPIGVKANAGKEITFSATSLNLPEGIKVFIEDKENNTITNLNKSNYTVSLKENLNGTGRFFLSTASKVLSTENTELTGISIYTKNNSTLNISGLKNGKATISIFNILGKQLLNTSFEVSTNNEISLPKLATGVYIVKLDTENGTLNKKIILE